MKELSEKDRERLNMTPIDQRFGDVIGEALKDTDSFLSKRVRVFRLLRAMNKEDKFFFRYNGDTFGYSLDTLLCKKEFFYGVFTTFDDVSMYYTANKELKHGGNNNFGMRMIFGND